MNTGIHKVSGVIALVLLMSAVPRHETTRSASSSAEHSAPTYEWIPARDGEPAALLRVAPELLKGDAPRFTAAAPAASLALRRGEPLDTVVVD